MPSNISNCSYDPIGIQEMNVLRDISHVVQVMISPFIWYKSIPVVIIEPRNITQYAMVI